MLAIALGVLLVWEALPCRGVSARLGVTSPHLRVPAMEVNVGQADDNGTPRHQCGRHTTLRSDRAPARHWTVTTPGSEQPPFTPAGTAAESNRRPLLTPSWSVTIATSVAAPTPPYGSPCHIRPRRSSPFTLSASGAEDPSAFRTARRRGAVGYMIVVPFPI